jgi:hypothetical protein
LPDPHEEWSWLPETALDAGFYSAEEVPGGGVKRAFIFLSCDRIELDLNKAIFAPPYKRVRNPAICFFDE